MLSWAPVQETNLQRAYPLVRVVLTLVRPLTLHEGCGCAVLAEPYLYRGGSSKAETSTTTKVSTQQDALMNRWFDTARLAKPIVCFLFLRPGATQVIEAKKSRGGYPALIEKVWRSHGDGRYCACSSTNDTIRLAPSLSRPHAAQSILWSSLFHHPPTRCLR